MNEPQQTLPHSAMSSGTLPRRWTKLRPHALQRQLYHSRARFRVVPAGRRSGKTELAKRFLIRNLPLRKPWPDPRYFFGGPTYKQAREIAWDDLQRLTPPSWIRKVSQTDLYIETHFGSRVYVYGMDVPQRVEGPPWDGCVLDEMSDQKPSVFEAHVRPALADRQGGCWMIGKPYRGGIGAANFKRLYDYAVQSGDPAWAGFTWFSADILPAEEVEAAKRSMDLKTFREQFEASWESPAGLVYYAYEAQFNKRPCPYRSDRPIIAGSDFNVDPMAWPLCQRIGNELHVFDELWLHDANTQMALDVLHDRHGTHRAGFEFYGDASSSSRHTSAVTSDYEQIKGDIRFQKLGRTVHYPKENPAQADRYAAVNALFCNAAGERRLFIDPRCEHLLFDVENGYFKPNTREAMQTQELSHATAGLGYVVHALFPIKGLESWAGPTGEMGDGGFEGEG